MSYDYKIEVCDYFNETPTGLRISPYVWIIYDVPGSTSRLHPPKRLSFSDCIKLLSSLVPTIKHVEFISGSLRGLEIHQLKQLFSALPLTVDTLDLSDSGIGEHSDYSYIINWHEALHALPISVKELRLRKLDRDSAPDLGPIPTHVTKLKLCWRSLVKKKGAYCQLSTFIGSVTHLDLRYNRLHKLTLDRLNAPYEPVQSVREIKLDYDGIRRMDLPTRRAFQKIFFPNAEKIYLYTYIHSAKANQFNTELGLTCTPPSLKNQLLPFVVKNLSLKKIEEGIEHLPKDLIDEIEQLAGRSLTSEPQTSVVEPQPANDELQASWFLDLICNKNVVMTVTGITLFVVGLAAIFAGVWGAAVLETTALVIIAIGALACTIGTILGGVGLFAKLNNQVDSSSEEPGLNFST